MTIQRLFFRAHERYTVLLRTDEYALDARLEQLGGGQSMVLNLAVFVAGGVLRPGAQFLADEHVGNPVLCKRCCEPIFVEMRVPSAERPRAHVRDGGDVIGREQAYELLDCVVGMSNRVDGCQISAPTFPRKRAVRKLRWRKGRIWPNRSPCARRPNALSRFSR